MKRSHLAQLSLFMFAFASIATTASAAIKREQVEHHNLDGIKEVVFEISGGNVDVVGSDRSDLELALEYKFKVSSEEEADKLDEQIKRTVMREGDRLIIKLEYNNRSGGGFWESLFSNGNAVQINAELELPRNLQAKLQTSGGNIQARSMDAPLNLRTSGGNIKAQQIQGDLDAHTSGGNVSVSDFAGHAKLHTSGGNIAISGAVSALDAHTSGGNISATFDQGISQATDLDTNGGSITAKLPREQAFRLQAKTSGGSVDYTHGGTLEGSVKKNKIDAVVNGGGPVLSARTSGGNITIAAL